MERKNGSKYDSSTKIPLGVLIVTAMVILAFFAVGAGGLVLFGFYMMAVMSLIWVGFAQHGPIVGLIAFAVIVAFFGVIGLFVHHLLTSKVDKHDRGDNHDNY